MNALVAFAGVVILLLVAYLGVGIVGLEFLFGVAVPYAAILVFLVGFCYRIVKWARSAVPFRITTTCGQQKALRYFKGDNLENPHNVWGVIGRMALEVLFFRSLFRNTKAELREGQKLVYSPDKWLWAGALVFHWSFLIVVLRHFRFFAEPVPSCVLGLQSIDGFFQIGVPIVYVSTVALVASVTYLFVRRVVIPQVRYISLTADHFAVLLILAVAVSGLLMRHVWKVDVVRVKELATGLVSLDAAVPEGIGVIFFMHLFLVSVLFAYFPFSKLMHLGGIFLSPTKNLVNNNRRTRHVNPWNYPVKVHTYAEYEDEYRDVMREAGMPLEKDELPVEKGE